MLFYVLVGIPFFLTGAFLLLAVYKDWSFLFEMEQTKKLVYMYGREGARIVITISGLIAVILPFVLPLIIGPIELNPPDKNARQQVPGSTSGS